MEEAAAVVVEGEGGPKALSRYLHLRSMVFRILDQLLLPILVEGVEVLCVVAVVYVHYSLLCYLLLVVDMPSSFLCIC